MKLLCWLILLTAGYPLVAAWQANRRTTLLHAIHWAIVAWAAWVWAFAPPGLGQTPAPEALTYVALSLTGCAGVAVLGARRPGVRAWNFVVGALLVVMLLPLTESLIAAPELSWAGLRAVFLWGTLAVCALNYVPTRLGPAALLLMIGAACEIVVLFGPHSLAAWLEPHLPGSRLLLVLSPWAAYGAMRWQERPAVEFDRLWLDFRDRFGLFWGQRLRDQFNHAATHAAWPVYLRWQGLRLRSGAPLPNVAVRTAMVETLRALMKRFGPDIDSPAAES